MSFEFAFPLREFVRQTASGAEVRFLVRIEVEPPNPTRQWSFWVVPVGFPGSTEESYYAGLREVKPGVVQLEATHNNLPEEYRGCCITCGLVQVVADHLNVTVRSSRTIASQQADGVEEFDESRSETADKVWKRMVTELGARYVDEEDRYYYDRTAS